MMCVFAIAAIAQEAEQIDLGPYGVLNVRTNKKTIEYFETQIKLWEKKVHQNKKDANAWLNYFAATKYASQIDIARSMESSKPRININESKFEYSKIADEAYNFIPNTFEANYMKHFTRDNLIIKRDYSYLLKAQKINPYDIRILDALIRYYYLINDTENIKKLAFEIVQNNLISDKEYNLAYNILCELEDQAILITNYYNIVDFLVLQYTKNIKPNVIIAPKNIIAPTHQKDYVYTDILLKRIGIKRREVEIDTSGRIQKDWIEKNKETARNYIQDVFNAKLPVYVVNNTLLNEEFGSKLYLHGLTYRYLEKPFNYVYVIKENYEKNYSLDYIKHDISQSPIDNYEKSLYSIYYLSARRLQQFYKSKNMYLQQKEIEDFIHILAEKAGKEFIGTLEYMDRKIDCPFIAEKIDFEKLEASFVALNTVDHIGKFEITNGEYNLFLSNLKKTKNFELYYKCLIDSVGWESTFVNSYHDPMTDTYGWHPAYKSYPVVNIPYEGAVEYCKWLTIQYNQQHPEGKYVSFRLPTEQEWRYAAGSKKEKARSPFPNDSIISCDPPITGKKKLKNETNAIKNCKYLGNIKTDLGLQTDGGFHTSSVTSYLPNGLGIYNTFGNVSEMTSTKDVIKGGSWADLFSECTFDKNATYSALDPRVGFRIMMEVVPNFAPCYTIKIFQNLYCDEYDVTIKDYKKFVDWNKQIFGENSSEYKNSIPDTSTWNETKKLILFDNDSKVDCKIKEFETLNNLTNAQIEKFNEWRSNQVFKDYLISKKIIQNISAKNETKENYFTKEKYFKGFYPHIISSEKINYYPEYRQATELEKRMIQKYSDSIVTNKLYDFKKGLAIHSNPFIIQNYNLIIDPHSSNSDCIYYFNPKVKKQISPFNIWENYRMIVEWKPWNSNQTK